MNATSANRPTDERVRPLIYQLMVRSFGNTNETRKPNGTLAENGCGKFNDINRAALAAITDLGFTHVWLTGVLEQASGTAYPNRPADVADILKGVAGSPYAIRDYFDVCPDYAQDPERRIDEFIELLDRCHAHGLRVIIDFVPNHVARSYASDVRPDLSFGVGDERGAFFARDNHFYYLRASDPGGGPPLKLPTAGKPGCSGSYAHGKLLRVIQQPAFVAGGFYGLNHANRDNPHFGRMDGETVSGHWLYAFLRHDPQSGQAFVVVANFHGSATLCQVRVRIPPDAIEMLGRDAGGTWEFADRLDSGWTGRVDASRLAGDGLALPDLWPRAVP